jgi:hypothetical protein
VTTIYFLAQLNVDRSGCVVRFTSYTKRRASSHQIKHSHLLGLGKGGKDEETYSSVHKYLLFDFFDINFDYYFSKYLK